VCEGSEEDVQARINRKARLGQVQDLVYEPYFHWICDAGAGGGYDDASI